MLAGGHELTWWGPWISQLTSLKGGLMTLITGRWRKGNSPSKPLYKLTSVVLPSSPCSCPSCLLPAISVHKPLEGFVSLNGFFSWDSSFNILAFFDLQTPAYLSRLWSNVISLMSFYSFIPQIFIKQGTVLAITRQAVNKMDKDPSLMVLMLQ